MTTDRPPTTPQPRSSARYAEKRSSTSTNTSVAHVTGDTAASSRLSRVFNLVVNVIWIVFSVLIVVTVIGLLLMGEDILEVQIPSQEEAFPL